MFRLFKLFTLFFALLCVGSLAAPLDGSTTSAHQARGLERRQTIVQGTVCANVPIRVTVGVVGYTLINGICLCTEAGVLTPDSVARLNAQVLAGASTTGSVINTVAGLVGGVTNLLPLARAAGQGAVVGSPATCPYPANSTPVCPGTAGANVLPGSTTCSFTCDAGFTLCGTSFCIPTGSQCVSGIPARRRSLTQQAAAGELCPAGLQACYTADMASLAMGKSVGYECVDVATDMESCGGCQFPIMGEARGEDCTAKAGVDNVSCVAGQCRASSCMRGFKLNGTECIEAAVKTFWKAI
ncbi:hypothetical protein NCC49_004043 [Naganishia albida]|nr:hypothetical protein NCC49_004043 [Naganishia albida]